jgi:hypothetical protein
MQLLPNSGGALTIEPYVPITIQKTHPVVCYSPGLELQVPGCQTMDMPPICIDIDEQNIDLSVADFIPGTCVGLLMTVQIKCISGRAIKAHMDTY